MKHKEWCELVQPENIELGKDCNCTTPGGWEQEFDYIVFPQSMDILYDNGVGNHGKITVVMAELKAFIREQVRLAEKRGLLKAQKILRKQVKMLASGGKGTLTNGERVDFVNRYQVGIMIEELGLLVNGKNDKLFNEL